MVCAGPGAPKELSPRELFMGRDLPLAFHHHARLNRRVQLKIVKFVIELEKYIQTKQFEKIPLFLKRREKSLKR